MWSTRLNANAILNLIVTYGPVVAEIIGTYGPKAWAWIEAAHQDGTLEDTLEAAATDVTAIESLAEKFKSAAPVDLGNPTPAQDRWSGSHAR